jgi:hypothetical protein
MNGRVQDPILGRFVSADPGIPGISTQDFNRYSYVRNNPLSLTDPSGFIPNGNFNSPDRVDGDDGMLSGPEEVARTSALTAFQTRYPGGNAPRVWDFATFSGWFRHNQMQGHRTGGSNSRWIWIPGHEISIIPEGDGGDTITGSSAGRWEPLFAPLPNFGGIGGSTHGPRCELCHRTIAKQPPSPGFWEVDGFVYNYLGVGTIDCLFSVGPNKCSVSALDGAIYIAGVVPFTRGAGALKAFGHTADQKALKELVDEVTFGGRKHLSRADAETILDWADEVRYPGVRASPGDLATPSNWISNPVPHIHLPGAGRGGHVPVEPGVLPR